MEAHISTAFSILIIGMITVFVILGLVVLTGQLLIRTVNAFFPIKEVEVPKTAKPDQGRKKAAVNHSTIAAIVAVVDMVTKGKGKPDKIEKIN